MSADDVERMADGIMRLRGELLRHGTAAGAPPAAELTSPQALALHALVGGGRLRMGVLADVLGVSAAAASRIVDGLEDRQLAVRRRDPDDRRAVWVDATPRGRREHDRGRRRLVTALERLLACLDPAESRELARLLQRVPELLAGVSRRP